MQAVLRQQGFVVNHKKLRRLMREHDLHPRRRQRFVSTTDGNHDLPIFPNLAREIVPDGPDQLWVADITYVAIPAGFVYVAVTLIETSLEAAGAVIQGRVAAPPFPWMGEGAETDEGVAIYGRTEAVGRSSIGNCSRDDLTNPPLMLKLFQDLLAVWVVGLLAKDTLEFGNLFIVSFLRARRLVPVGLLLLGHRTGDPHGAGLHVDDDVVGMGQGLGQRR